LGLITPGGLPMGPNTRFQEGCRQVASQLSWERPVEANGSIDSLGLGYQRSEAREE
jgi:hypothetical protein